MSKSPQEVFGSAMQIFPRAVVAYVALDMYVQEHGSDVTLRADYSGRGMYGKQCIAIDTPRACETAFRLGAYLRASFYEDDYAEIMDALAKCSTDAMGQGSVLYFPQLQVPAVVRVAFTTSIKGALPNPEFVTDKFTHLYKDGRVCGLQADRDDLWDFFIYLHYVDKWHGIGYVYRELNEVADV